MSKSKWIPVLAALIPVVGLTSCAKDSKGQPTIVTVPAPTPGSPEKVVTPEPAGRPVPEPETTTTKATVAPSPTRGLPTDDVMAVVQKTFPPPIIVRANAKFTLVDWDKQADRDLGLGESIDVGTPAPPFTEIVANCGQGSERQEFKKQFANLSNIPTFKMIPTTFLTRDLKDRPVDCHFTVKMSEDGRLNNGFELEARVIDDHGMIALQGRDVNPHGRSELRALGLLGHKISLPVDDEAEARLECTDLTFEKVKFTGSLDLNDFKIDHPRGRHDQSPDKSIAERPKQLCRVVVSGAKDEARKEMTQLFDLHFNKEKWVARFELDQNIQYGSLKDAGGFQMATLYIKNLDHDERRLRFNKLAYGIDLAINTDRDLAGLVHLEKPASITYARILPHDVITLKKDESFTVHPNETAKFMFMFDLGRHSEFKCDDTRVQARFSEDIYLQDITADGNLVSASKLEMPSWSTKLLMVPAHLLEMDVSKTYDKIDANCHF